MLQTETVDDSILELLRSLQTKAYLEGFNLVGGTALALYLGHRKSVDIDLFSNFGFDVPQMLEKYDLPDMLIFYKTKYKQENEGPVLKSLIYFDDVDFSDRPVIIKNPGLKWGGIKKRIESVVLKYVRK